MTGFHWQHITQDFIFVEAYMIQESLVVTLEEEEAAKTQ